MSSRKSKSERKITTNVSSEPVVDTGASVKEPISSDAYDTDSGGNNGKMFIFVIVAILVMIALGSVYYVVRSYKNAKALTEISDKVHNINEDAYVGVDSTDIVPDSTKSFAVAKSDTITEDFSIYTFYIVDDATNTVTIINTIFNNEDAVINGIKNLYPPGTKFTFVHQTEAMFTRESITNTLQEDAKRN